jgi:hypothetical protein
VDLDGLTLVGSIRHTGEILKPASMPRRYLTLSLLGNVRELLQEHNRWTMKV